MSALCAESPDVRFRSEADIAALQKRDARSGATTQLAAILRCSFPYRALILCFGILVIKAPNLPKIYSRLWQFEIHIVESVSNNL